MAGKLPRHLRKAKRMWQESGLKDVPKKKKRPKKDKIDLNEGSELRYDIQHRKEIFDDLKESMRNPPLLKARRGQKGEVLIGDTIYDKGARTGKLLKPRKGMEEMSTIGSFGGLGVAKKYKDMTNKKKTKDSNAKSMKKLRGRRPY